MINFVQEGQRVAIAARRAAVTLITSDRKVRYALGIAVAATILPSLIGGRPSAVSAPPSPPPAAITAPVRTPPPAYVPAPANAPLPDTSGFLPGARVRVLALGRNGQLGEEVGVFVLTRPAVTLGEQHWFGVAFDGPAAMRIEGAINAEIGGRYQLGFSLQSQEAGRDCQVAIRVGQRTVVEGHEFLTDDPRTIVGGIDLTAGMWPVTADIGCGLVKDDAPVWASLVLRRPPDKTLLPAIFFYRGVAGDNPQPPFGETMPSGPPPGPTGLPPGPSVIIR